MCYFQDFQLLDPLFTFLDSLALNAYFWMNPLADMRYAERSRSISLYVVSKRYSRSLCDLDNMVLKIREASQSGRKMYTGTDPTETISPSQFTHITASTYKSTRTYQTTIPSFHSFIAVREPVSRVPLPRKQFEYLFHASSALVLFSTFLPLLRIQRVNTRLSKPPLRHSHYHKSSL